MRRKSRLTRHIESRTKKDLAITLGIILIVTFLLIKFGIPLFANVGLFISGLKNKSIENNQTKEKIYVMPPVLNPLPDATSSAQIIVSGKGVKNQEIKIYVNDSFSEETNVSDDGNFSVTVDLEKDDNYIKAKAFEGKNFSEFSEELKILVLTSPPKLEISQPSEGQNFSKDNQDIEVKGSTETGVNVTVNGFVAIVDENGSFSYRLRLQGGDNNIKIVAYDDAGNKTEKELKVTYSQ